MSSLHVTLVSVHETLWQGEARQVIAPAIDGSMGILPQMQPTLSILDEGEVRVDPVDGSPVSFRVSGGFVSVDEENQVTLGVDAVLAAPDQSAR